MRAIFHWRLVVLIFSTLRLWHLHVAMVSFARYGWFVAMIPISLLSLVDDGVRAYGDYAQELAGNGVWLAVPLIAVGVACEVILLAAVLMLLDLVWFAITAPRQFLLGSLFTNEKIERGNLDHMEYLGKMMRQSSASK